MSPLSPTSLPPSTPCHPSGLSQGSRFECPASYRKSPLAGCFTYGSVSVSLLLSIPPSLSFLPVSSFQSLSDKELIGYWELSENLYSCIQAPFPPRVKWHREVKTSPSFLLLVILSGVLSVLQTFLKHQLLVFLVFPFSISLFSALVCSSLLLLILGLIYSFSSFSRWKHRLLIWDISFQDKRVML